MTYQDQTPEQKRAAADAAKEKATEARNAATAAPNDAALQTAASEAEAEATRLETEATAPSHEPRSQRTEISKKDKIKKRIEILREQYISEGGDPADFNEEDAEAAAVQDDDKPLTKKDLQSMGVIKSAEQLANEITDAELRGAVLEEMKSLSRDLPPQQRYEKAVQLASSSKNARVAQEARRMGSRVVQQHSSGGGGAPANADDGEFRATPQEKIYMDKYKLTKEQIIQSRKDAAGYNFGPGQK